MRTTFPRILIVLCLMLAGLLIALTLSPLPAHGAAIQDYTAPGWSVSISPNCQDAVIAGLMPHPAQVQVLIYPPDSSDPIYANVTPMLSGYVKWTVHIAAPIPRWQIVALTYEGAPWLEYTGAVSCASSVADRPRS